jgi:hypothetical protein
LLRLAKENDLAKVTASGIIPFVGWEAGRGFCKAISSQAPLPLDISQLQSPLFGSAQAALNCNAAEAASLTEIGQEGRGIASSSSAPLT